MYSCLSLGNIRVSVPLEDGLLLAQENGFAGLEVSIKEIADRADRESMGDIKQLFRDAGLVPGAWGLPVNWRGDEDAMQSELEELKRLAAAARELGCPRTFTWISPASGDRSFDDNFAWHRDRLKPTAAVLNEYGCSLGLEFIGTPTLRHGKKHEFIYTLNGMLELCEAIGTGNVGLLLDCWHWFTSGGTVSDIRKLQPAQVVYVHVNDAPAGVALDAQLDNTRCMPGETGVIDIGGFLNALQEIGYDGPITAEPFSSRVNGLAPAEAVRMTAEGMRAIWKTAGLSEGMGEGLPAE